MKFKAFLAALAVLFCLPAAAQTPPSERELAAYTDLHAAAAKGDVKEIKRLAASGADVNKREGYGRTPLMIAAYARQYAAADALIAAGADLNALETDRYDVVTIASVADDVKMLKKALAAGASPGLTTSPYDGTALIAAAHLGHVEVVQTLIKAGAPLDHINNLRWTALIEPIVLGDGGPNHIDCLKALVDAGADVNIPDGNGVSPLKLAQRHGFDEMVKILKAAGAK